jgi:predicted Zn-dependent peptidase
MVQKTVLPNGLRIITENIPHLVSVAMGIWVDNGSRDESPEWKGISHFIEHMIFKGTKKRSAQQIAKELDAIGGLSNAFTSREQTCFHAKVLGPHLPQVTEILLDIFLQSVFDPEEVEREQLVVLQEISMVEDTPDEYVHVLYGETVYEGNPLGQNILGTPATVRAFTQDQLRRYLRRAYGPEKVVVAAAGQVDHEAFVSLLAPELSQLPPAGFSPDRQQPGLTSKFRVVSRDLEQVHLALGGWAPAATDGRRYAGTLLNVIVGGNMSSRLFQEVREKRGLAYAIYSYLSSFQDTGIWGIYTAVAKETLAETLEVIGRELLKVKRGEVTANELAMAKEFVKGGIWLGAENSDNRMSRLAKNELHFGRDLPFEEIMSGLDAVTREDLAELADTIIRGDRFSLVALGPVSEGEFPSPWISWA